MQTGESGRKSYRKEILFIGWAPAICYMLRYMLDNRGKRVDKTSSRQATHPSTHREWGWGEAEGQQTQKQIIVTFYQRT